MRLAAARVVRVDHQQARVLALRAGVGLQRYRVVAGDGAQHPLEVGDELAVALASDPRARTDAARRTPATSPASSRRRVELHRARAQRDHRAIEREVLVGEPAQVAQHLRFAVIAVEHRMREERRRARERRPGCASATIASSVVDVERRRGRRRTPARARRRQSRVVVSSSEMPSDRRVDPAQVDAGRDARARRFAPVAVAGRERRSCRRTSPWRRDAEPLEPCAQDRRQPVHAPRDRRQPVAARDRRRTCWRSPRAAPAPCRCSTSPFRGGCAARASAARAGTRARRSRRR